MQIAHGLFSSSSSSTEPSLSGQVSSSFIEGAFLFVEGLYARPRVLWALPIDIGFSPVTAAARKSMLMSKPSIVFVNVFIASSSAGSF